MFYAIRIDGRDSSRHRFPLPFIRSIVSRKRSFKGVLYRPGQTGTGETFVSKGCPIFVNSLNKRGLELTQPVPPLHRNRAARTYVIKYIAVSGGGKKRSCEPEIAHCGEQQIPNEVSRLIYNGPRECKRVSLSAFDRPRRDVSTCF